MGPTGATGPAGNSAPMQQFSVALNSPVPLSNTAQPVPFTIVLCGNDDGSFNLMEYYYKVPMSGRYCFTELQKETYTFPDVSTGVFLSTMTLEYFGFFEAQTPVFVTATSTAAGTTILGPTVLGFPGWSTLFTGRMI